jgi:hypothetical protein
MGGCSASDAVSVPGMRNIRVTVRGAFDALTESQRAELLAAQAEHDFLHTVYTPEGHLAYDVAARPFFTFRFAKVAEEKDIPDAAAQAELDAMAWLDERGYGYKNLTTQAVDMSEVPLGARGRRVNEGRLRAEP